MCVVIGYGNSIIYLLMITIIVLSPLVRFLHQSVDKKSINNELHEASSIVAIHSVLLFISMFVSPAS